MSTGSDRDAVTPAVTDGTPQEPEARPMRTEAVSQAGASLDTITLTQIMALKEPTRTLTLEALHASGERSFFLRAKGSNPIRQRYGKRVLIVPAKDTAPKPFLLAHALHIVWYDRRRGGPNQVEEVPEAEV